MIQAYTQRFDAVFLDYEGTLNDSRESGRRYARELARYLARRFPEYSSADYGRGVLAAMDATRAMAEDAGSRTSGWPGYSEYRRRELRAWLRTLLAGAGLPAALDDAAADALAEDLIRNVKPVLVPTPGAVEALATLAEAGVRMYVSSGATTEYTAQCLRDAGLIGVFAAIFGPDQLDLLKAGPEFFARCFRASGVRPGRACVVDDSAGPLRWALELGASAIGVGVPVAQVTGGLADTGGGRYIAVAHLGELPSALVSFNL